MKNKIDLKVNFENINRPKFYKKVGQKWVGISEQQFNEICRNQH